MAKTDEVRFDVFSKVLASKGSATHGSGKSDSKIRNRNNFFVAQCEDTKCGAYLIFVNWKLDLYRLYIHTRTIVICLHDLRCRPCAWFWKPQGCQNDKDT